MSSFQKFAVAAANQKPRFPQFCETALIEVLIDSLNRNDLGPKILRSFFFHCYLLQKDGIGH